MGDQVVEVVRQVQVERGDDRGAVLAVHGHDEVDVVLEGVLDVIVLVVVQLVIDKIRIGVLDAGTVVAAVAEVVRDLVFAVGHGDLPFALSIQTCPGPQRTSGSRRSPTRC